MKPIRKTRHALMFMGAGAVAAYFLDPEAGPERRERVLQQVQSLTGQTGSGSGGSEVSSGKPEASVQSSSASAEPFAGSSTGDSDRGPIDLATGEPLWGSSASPGVTPG